MQWLRFAFTLLLVLAAQLSSRAQTQKIDSLKKLLPNTSGTEARLAALFALCDEKFSLPADTLYHYASLAKQLAIKLKDKRAAVLADYNLAASLVKKGLRDSALQLIDRHYKTVQQRQDDPELQNRFSFLKGQALMRSNRIREAMEVYFAALQRAEKNRDTLASLMANNCIGWAHMELDQNREAIIWFHKAINTVSDPAYFDQYNLVFSNMAATYNAIGRNDSAEHFIRRSLYCARRQQNLQAVANALAIHADIFIDTKRIALAEAALKEAIEIRRQIGEPFYIVSDMSQLAVYYAHNGQPAKGIALCMEGIRMARQYNLSSKLSFLYSALAENYKSAGNWQAYGETLQKLLVIKDSLYEAASADALASLEARYDVQKKENIILQQQFDLARKNYWIFGSILVLVLILTSLYLLFKVYKRKQELRWKLLREEEKRRSEQEVIAARDKERKRIAADLHDSLGAYAASISSNIDHLQIEHAQKNKVILQELHSNAQAIVAQLSDTIWVLKKDALPLTSISDRLKLFIQTIAPSYPEVMVDVREEIQTDHLLLPAQAFQLFQIIKEALNNALRHSRCSYIIVRVDGRQGWRISVSDDGSGLMQRKAVATGGNGLANMRTRAEESGWKIEWHTNQPRGTSVVIEPTIN